MSQDKKVEVESFTDKAGQVVKRGDCIAYGRIRLQSGDLNFGKVTNIKQGKDYYDRDVWAITIVALDQEYDCETRKYSYTVMEKKTSLQFPERIVKFDNLPENIKILLDSV
jgi:hypothetical protein